MRRLSLEAWLARLPTRDPRQLLIGATGHLKLSAAERDVVSDRLTHDTLPTLIDRARPERVSLVTGLAPGADLLFKQIAGPWFAERGIPHDTIAVLPVPLPVLIDDWITRLDEQGVILGPERIRSVSADIQTQLDRCAAVIELVEQGLADPQIGDVRYRQTQYRRLAAFLAEQADVLIAILRGSRGGLPGGAAEVVEWRSRPARIPPVFSTLHLRSPETGGRPLLVIDPGRSLDTGTGRPRESVETLLSRCQDALRAGNYLLCHDLASRALAEGADTQRLQYLQLLSLANAGNCRLALQRFHELPLPSVHADEPQADTCGVEEWLALHGRLLKDLALTAADPAQAQALFVEAGETYRRAFDHAAGYFPGINAATTLMLGGRTGEAQIMARRVLMALAQRSTTPAGSDIEQYYRSVTEAEAALLLGDVERAGSLLVRAAPLATDNLNALSRTRSQLQLICRHLGLDARWVDRLEPPPVCVLAPVPASAPTNDGAVSRLPPSASLVCLALLSPEALTQAELARQRGIRAHLVLPMPRERLIDDWVQQHGGAAAGRLRGWLDAGGECSVLHGFLDGEADWRQHHAEATAFGLARLEARRLGAALVMIDAEGRERRDDGAPPPSALDAAAATGADGARRIIGALFADFCGYSRLRDDDHPAFQTRLMGAIGAVLAGYRDTILVQRSWGDAVHVVTTDALTTARIAHEIHEAVTRVHNETGTTLQTLELRLSAHYAPVFTGVDPIDGRATCYGSPLSFAARIEPVTPPGLIYVTEAFAARLMIEDPEHWAAEYAGEVALAKGYGKYRLFSLRAVR